MFKVLAKKRRGKVFARCLKVKTSMREYCVPDAGGEEPSDDGEVSDEASKWVEKGVASLLLLYACRSQSFLQGIFHCFQCFYQQLLRYPNF